MCDDDVAAAASYERPDRKHVIFFQDLEEGDKDQFVTPNAKRKVIPLNEPMPMERMQDEPPSS